jgi:hypothetical protein
MCDMTAFGGAKRLKSTLKNRLDEQGCQDSDGGSCFRSFVFGESKKDNLFTGFEKHSQKRFVSQSTCLLKNMLDYLQQSLIFY